MTSRRCPECENLFGAGSRSGGEVNFILRICVRFLFGEIGGRRQWQWLGGRRRSAGSRVKALAKQFYNLTIKEKLKVKRFENKEVALAAYNFEISEVSARHCSESSPYVVENWARSIRHLKASHKDGGDDF
ncbi:hypothetical protein EVAR_38037_1 [Eumeta japonica]|uniref:Uncharacterized protein n=1 Tax=Eumeta variegata TaxID=151549 RepID=A0A4C1W8C4_EUMVA|nr:hypothetical protein EVAR_38037_1 [Eumeta japonica]